MSSEPIHNPSPWILDRWLPQSGKSVCVCVVFVSAVVFFGLWLLIAISTPEPVPSNRANANRGTHPALTAAQVFGGLLVPLIAGIAAYIAWQQKETTEYKVKLDLFDRRYRVYRGLMDLLAAVVRDEIVSPEVLGKFYSETDMKRFLFGEDINDYLKAVREKIVNVRQLMPRIEPHPSISEEQRGEAIEKKIELISWLDEQITEAAKKFDHYMSFKKL